MFSLNSFRWCGLLCGFLVGVLVFGVCVLSWGDVGCGDAYGAGVGKVWLVMSGWLSGRVLV